MNIEYVEDTNRSFQVKRDVLRRCSLHLRHRPGRIHPPALLVATPQPGSHLRAPGQGRRQSHHLRARTRRHRLELPVSRIQRRRSTQCRHRRRARSAHAPPKQRRRYCHDLPHLRLHVWPPQAAPVQLQVARRHGRQVRPHEPPAPQKRPGRHRRHVRPFFPSPPCRRNSNDPYSFSTSGEACVTSGRRTCSSRPSRMARARSSHGL